MGDESGSSALPTDPSAPEDLFRPKPLQRVLNRLASELVSTSRKSEILAEPYTTKRRFDDPDPGRSHLCYECNTFMNNLHCHPWNDAQRVEIPIGETDNYTMSHDQRYHHRSIEGVDGCVLCSLILEIIIAKFCPNSEDCPNISRWGYVLKPTHFGSVLDSEPRRSFGQKVSTTKTPHARWYLGVEIDDTSGSKVPRLISNAIQCAIRPLPKPCKCLDSQREQAIFEHRAFLNGRARELEYDPGLLRSWLYLCDRHHGTQCSPRVDRQGPDIRLIDTKNQCIVSRRLLDSSTHQDYVALSYVWGDVEQLYVPAGEAYSVLTKKGALLDLKPPKTVMDAMLLIQQLGLRYLWVDALCIKQDDFSDKEEQIARMGSVFQSALFTIIAGSGSDCDAGLPGIRPGTRFKRQQLVEAGNITLLSSVQHPYETILTPGTSKWARRAWTFQEELLSRRRLIFTDEQVWWRCPCATWCEQSQLETEDSIGFLLSGQAIEPSLRQRYSKLRPKDYFDLVSKYAQRELSYPSDALNAFKGILTILTDYSNEQFFWGLANSTFERQLYWFGRAKMRTTLQDDCFPTWSWVDWEGEISFRHYQTYRPVVVCFTMIKDEKGQDTTQLVCSPSTSFGARNYDLPLKDALVVSMEAIGMAYSITSLKPNFHIFFYTYSAMFYLMPQGRLILPDHPPRYAYDEKGNVLGPKPDYGYLVPSLDERELCAKGCAECILLGKRPAASAWEEAHVVVMLISRKRGYAQRVGIADMSEQFWDLAGKTWELIALG